MLEELNTVPAASSNAVRPKVSTVTRLIALPFRWLKEDEEPHFSRKACPTQSAIHSPESII
jgi:hypothetical protein